LPRYDMSIISEALKKAQEERANKQKQKKSSKEASERIFPETTFTIQNVSGEKPAASRILLRVISFVIILALAGGAFFYFSRSSSNKEAAPLAKPAEPVITAAPEPAVPREPREKAESVSVPAENASEKIAEVLPPPSEKNVIEPAPRDLPALSGIMYSASDPKAIINGVMVCEGETIDGFSVRKITAGKVTISYGDDEFELKLR